jgi:hypothetical protein
MSTHEIVKPPVVPKHVAPFFAVMFTSELVMKSHAAAASVAFGEHCIM